MCVSNSVVWQKNNLVEEATVVRGGKLFGHQRQGFFEYLALNH